MEKTEKTEKTVKFRDLSEWMKVAIIGGFISIFSFAYGFLYGLFLL